MGDVKFRTIRGDKGIVSHKTLCGKPEIELPKKVTERIGKKLGSLLDKSRSSRCFTGGKGKVFQQFVADAATFHADAETDQLDEAELALACEILSGIFNK